MHGQVIVTNWVTTYGEVIVRVPQRALTWKNANAVGGNVSYVVGTDMPQHDARLAAVMQDHVKSV